jgi:hypothetical protein
MQRVEVGDAVDADNDGLAIEHEPLLPDLARGLGDPGISLGLDVAAARDQRDAITVALDAEAKAVVLDFVEPLRSGRNLRAGDREAELKRLIHAANIGVRGAFPNSTKVFCCVGPSASLMLTASANPTKLADLWLFPTTELRLF